MNSNNQEQRSLIMCLTPLQMIIAEKIIGLKPEEKFDLVVIAPFDSDKYKYYYDRLKSICINSIYYTEEVGIKGFFSYINKLRVNRLDKKYQNLYLANIQSRHLQYILSKSPSSNIYTFDDGIGNIIQSGLFYLDNKPKLFKRAFWRVLGIKYYMKDIKNLSLLHYTIYKDVPNVIKKTQLIKLYSEHKSNYKPLTSVVKIYLGQPIEELPTDLDNNYVTKVVEELNIDFYYPHPREKSIPTGNFKVIESPLVFEDYIASYLEDNPEVMVEIYSFISSAMLNIASLDHVNLNYIYNSYLYDKYRDFYDFSQREFNINYLEI